VWAKKLKSFFKFVKGAELNRFFRLVPIILPLNYPPRKMAVPIETNYQIRYGERLIFLCSRRFLPGTNIRELQKLWQLFTTDQIQERIPRRIP